MIGTQPPNLLQIFCEFMLNYKLIFISYQNSRRNLSYPTVNGLNEMRNSGCVYFLTGRFLLSTNVRDFPANIMP